MADLTQTVRLADVVTESVVDGKGIRMTVFVQGCKHACPGCQNPTTWDINGGKEFPLQFIADLAKKDPLLDGLTLSGGEPFLQAAPLAELAEWCHENNLNVWSYSGYTYEELLAMGEKDGAILRLLHSVDVLVDGPFIEAKKDLTLAFRGSSNQRVIDMAATRQSGTVTLLPL